MNPTELHRVVRAVNQIAGEWHGERNCCIFASGVLLDVLHARGQHQARPVRIEACASRVILGFRGDGTWQPATPGMWSGHMSVMVDDMLLDPTLDQIDGQLPFSGPYAENWMHAWYAVDAEGKATQVWPRYPGEIGYAVRYVLVRDREGWASAPAWRRKRDRRAVVDRVLKVLA